MNRYNNWPYGVPSYGRKDVIEIPTDSREHAGSGVGRTAPHGRGERGFDSPHPHTNIEERSAIVDGAIGKVEVRVQSIKPNVTVECPDPHDCSLKRGN